MSDGSFQGFSTTVGLEQLIYAVIYLLTAVQFYVSCRSALTGQPYKKAFLVFGTVFLIAPSWAAFLYSAYWIFVRHDGYALLIFGYFWVGILINMVSSLFVAAFAFRYSRRNRRNQQDR